MRKFTEFLLCVSTFVLLGGLLLFTILDGINSDTTTEKISEEEQALINAITTDINAAKKDTARVSYVVKEYPITVWRIRTIKSAEGLHFYIGNSQKEFFFPAEILQDGWQEENVTMIDAYTMYDRTGKMVPVSVQTNGTGCEYRSLLNGDNMCTYSAFTILHYGLDQLEALEKIVGPNYPFLN